MEDTNKPCTWYRLASGIYETRCDVIFEFHNLEDQDTDEPSAHNFYYCPNCGRPIELLAIDPEDCVVAA